MAEHMSAIVDFIDEAIVHAEDEPVLAGIRKKINAHMKQFPLYPELV
jgi:glycine/serine hydroxymethyltransferase